MKIKPKLIINADDLGLTRGINTAIRRAHKDGVLSHASIMTSATWFDHAIKEVVEKCPSLKIGVHLNLTCENSLTKETLISDADGKLRTSFVKLLFKRKTQNFLNAAEAEFEAQFNVAIKNNIKIHHLDGHEHIHIIPSLNRIVRKLAKKYDIERVREINEGFLSGIVANYQTLSVENLMKWILLQFLSFFNNNDKKVGFHSIFSTCRVSSLNLFKALSINKAYQVIEVMLHPSVEDGTDDGMHLDKRFQDFLKSNERLIEYELCFNENLRNYDLA